MTEFDAYRSRSTCETECSRGCQLIAHIEAAADIARRVEDNPRDETLIFALEAAHAGLAGACHRYYENARIGGSLLE